MYQTDDLFQIHILLSFHTHDLTQIRELYLPPAVATSGTMRGDGSAIFVDHTAFDALQTQLFLPQMLVSCRAS
jgi:hypothetical protein